MRLDLEVLTPLGPAWCVGVTTDLDQPEWITFINSTGEPWFFRNVHIRRRQFITHGTGVSPWSHITPLLQDRIDYYKENGWLK